MKTAAIIPAGGKGTRTALDVPKQFYKIDGKELIVYTLEIFQKSPNIDEIIIAAIPEGMTKISSLCKKYNLTKVKCIVEGGTTRQDSVYNALLSQSFSNDDIIAVHDAARPLLTQSILNEAIDTAIKNDSVVTAIPAKDSLFSGGDSIHSYLDRNQIYYAQTPQVFKYKILINAFKKAIEENFTGTDEAMLVLRNRNPVQIVKGTSRNFKITDQKDLELFEMITKSDKL